MLLLLLLFPILSGAVVISLRNSAYFYQFSLISSFVIVGYAVIILLDSKAQVFPVLKLGALLLQADNISAIFIILTAFLTFVCIIASPDKSSSYFALFFLLEAIIIVFFLSTDLLTFFICFEFSLIPLFFIIGIWGSSNRIYAAYKFFLYTLAGSMAFLVAILFIYAKAKTLNFIELESILPNLPAATQKLLWVALFLAFAIKIPMFPFHTWLPDAHVEAPTGGSIMLAGILIKLGAYGFIKLSIPMLPEASKYFAPLVFMLSAIGVIYASIIAIMQTDMKKLIAYSSVAHMGLVTGGLFSLTQEGILGAIFQMISHGLISGALFLCVGLLYNRAYTREIIFYNGLVNRMPIFGFLFIIFSMASIGLPGTSGFVGEFLAMLGLFKTNPLFAIFCATSVILSACYMLYLCKRIIWGAGNLNIINNIAIRDLKTFELIPLGMLAAFIIILGIFPNLILNRLQYMLF